MKKIVKIKFKEPREVEIIYTEEKITISGVSIEQYHEQDCCENVYADFSILPYYEKQLKKLGLLSKIEIKNVEDMGFIIFCYGYQKYSQDEYDEKRLGILINCYNEQNGYYSDELKLIINDNGEKVGEYDVSKQTLNR